MRGAPAIAIVGILSLASELSSVDVNSEHCRSVENMFKLMKDKLEYLVTARPTAVNMKRACLDLCDYGNKMKDNNSMTVNLFIDK